MSTALCILGIALVGFVLLGGTLLSLERTERRKRRLHAEIHRRTQQWRS